MVALRLVVFWTVAMALAAGGAAPAGAAPGGAAPAGAAAAAPSSSPSVSESASVDIPGLRVAVHAEDATKPTVVLTNGARVACRVATTPLGTLTLSSVEQNGTDVDPVFFDAAFSDSIELALANRLRVLRPGESAELRLPVLPVGPTGSAVETVALSAAGPIGALYPIHSDRALQFAAAYAVPIASEGIGLCVVAGSGPAGGGATAGRPAWVMWVIIAVAALIGLVILILIIGLIRRRRSGRGPRAGTGAAAALLIVTAMVVLTSKATPARADIDVDPSLQGAWDSCSTIFHGQGGDPAEILPTLEGSGTTVRIVPANGDITHEGAASPTQIFVFWDIDDHHKYFGSGGEADPCTSLYHELYHAWEDATGGQDHTPCVGPTGPSGLPVNEVTATRAQNKLRKLLGMGERDHYGRTPLPDYCVPPSQQPHAKEACAAGGTCGDSNGDPHLSTFDRLRYDFQGVGEFVATRDPAGGFQIQVRQAPWSNSRLVAVNTAVAMDVAGNRVQVEAARGAPVLLVDGHGVPAESTSLSKGGSVDVTLEGYAAVITVHWPDGSAASVRAIGVWGLHLSVAPSAKHAGKLEGLLGNFDRDPSNDVVTHGSPVAKPTFDDLYPAFADGWRVTAASSLFTYQPGTSTATYTDKTFPDRPTKLDDVPARAAVEALCRRLGVTEPVVLAACVLDVGLTGQPDFGVELGTTQAITIGALDGTETELRVAKPGDKPQLTFTGSPGQAVFIDAPATTLPNLCSPLKLHDPTGQVINSGCLINGDGYIDRTVLTAAGQYAVSVEPGTATGAVWVKVVTAADQVTPITAGTPVPVSLERSGSLGVLSFDGKAGQNVLVSVPSSSLPNQCSPLMIKGPDGKQLSSGCIISGSGYVDRTELPVTGRYSVVVDPGDRAIGDARVLLYVAADQAGPVSVNGDEVVASLATPGSQARFTFAGAAGQRISVEVSASSLPNQCSPLRLLSPTGSDLGSGCVINGTGSISTATLPVAGSYTVVVDPVADSAGTTHLRVRSA
jgi:von Willebrand factor type D domain